MALVADSEKGLAAGNATRGAGGRTSLKPLRLLVPYLLRYRGRALLACAALLVAALATLAVPVAVRRMIDHGFSGEASLIDD